MYPSLDIACITTSGPKTGQTCVFPFTDSGKTCDGPYCCNTDNDAKGSWCSTKVDENGAHIAGHYGYCPESCLEPCMYYLSYFEF